MATEKRQNYKPLPKHHTWTVSSSSSTCTDRVTHLANPVIRHERVAEMFTMATQHTEGLLWHKISVIVNRIMMVTVNILWNELYL